MSQILKPLAFPLRGSRLIEASAGTGKTFTLALLYVRLVLGHGDQDSAYLRPLTPPEILVVTFTEAATKELRERIRLRLVDAAVCFEADPRTVTASASGENLLHDLRAEYSHPLWPVCARRLRLAAEWMDEAVISTIHAWCYRMLQEHAFDTRGLFERELVTDQTDLITEVVQDYWRVHFYPLDQPQAVCVQDVVNSPAALRSRLAHWLKRRESLLSCGGKPLPEEALADMLKRELDWRSGRECLEKSARERWQTHRDALETHLRDLRPHLNGTTHDSAHVDKFDALLAEIAAWSDGQEAPSKLKNFAQGAFNFKKKAEVQTENAHVAFQALADWQQVETNPPDPPFEPSLIAHAARWVGRELNQRLLDRAEMGFDDLLRQLDLALTPDQPAHPDAAPRPAARLAATIRGQFPVALIDEFQDTDPVQYRIFDRIYNTERNDPTTALILIGDPKQSIYAFRGADIYAYLDARHATGDRHYALGINYRSTTGLVAACNRLFEHADTHPRGAFRFKRDDTNPIPFQAVTAHGRTEQLILNNQTPPALTVWTLDQGDEPLSSDDYRWQMAAATATQITRWLQQSDAGSSGFERDGVRRPLRPQDIAILVRTGKEAGVMRTALAARGIHSVYLSDRESVFQTEEAADLLHWLRACAAPTDDMLVRAALGTNTLAMPMDWLEQLQHDELAWEEQIERFRGYQRIWQQQGVLAMLRRLMQDVELPTRLIGRDHGERILTNLLHLAEWLQAAATAIDGEQALIRHLSEHVGKADDEFILRLESDAELVKIITIHKSKGLEYPLVLLPFMSSWREVDGHTKQVFYRSEQGLLLELAGKEGSKTAWDSADDERLSEDMRLLYVALTRAEHGLWLGVAPLKQGNAKSPQLHKAAMGHLLNGGETFANPGEVWEALAQLCGDCPHLHIEPAPAPSSNRLAPTHSTQLDPARQAHSQHQLPWWIASYSALRLAALAPTGLDDSAPAPVPLASAETARQETALEESAALADAQRTARRWRKMLPDSHLHALPRGGQYGTFLHEILEWAAIQRVRDEQKNLLRGYVAAAESQALRLEMLQQRCALHGLTDWVELLDVWLKDFLDRNWMLTDLPDAHGQPPILSFCALTPPRIQVEMEFWMESCHVATSQLDQLVQTHTLNGAPRRPIGKNLLNGMLKGFIDLVFEQDGRYYVVDWKSNWLGPDDDAYTPAAMRTEILNKRYDLQYVLYLLALHRQLRARLPGYDYDRDVGGAIYVFLRGGYSASQGLFMDKPPKILIEQLDRLFAGVRLVE